MRQWVGSHLTFARRVVARAAAAAVAAMLILPPAGARAATPAGFFGLNYYFKDITSGDVLNLKKSGATTVRWTMNWSHIEPSSGHFDWSAADAVVGDLAAQGIRVLPVMWGSPGWVASSAITPPIAPGRSETPGARTCARRSSDTARAAVTGMAPTEHSIPAGHRCRSTPGRSGTKPIRRMR